MQADTSPELLQGVLPFLRAYPFPAWIAPLAHGLGTRVGVGLEPAWSNAAFDTIFGPHEAFLGAIGAGEALISYGTWLEAKEQLPSTYILSLYIPNDDDGGSKHAEKTLVELELAKTSVTVADGSVFIVCTSIPRTPLPKRDVSNSNAIRKKRKTRKKPLKLTDLPTYKPNQTRASSSNGSTTTAGSTVPRGFPGPRMDEMVAKFPWETTSLGPRELWDDTTVQAVEFTLSTPYPAALWWGEDSVLIYNDAYAVMSTTKHPRIFGQRGIDAWAELWDSLGPALKSVMAGNCVYKKDDQLFMDRLMGEQTLEETYHTWAYIPVHGRDKKIVGVFNSTRETSSKVVAERRMTTLQILGSRAAIAQNKQAFCQAVISTLEENDKDVSFAALYLSDEEFFDKHNPATRNQNDMQLQQTQLRLSLSGSIGVPEGHPYVPVSTQIMIDPSMLTPTHQPPKFQWPFAHAIQTKDVISVYLPTDVSSDFIRRGWYDRPTNAVVIPMSSEADSSFLGLLIMGLNTRRNLDADYNQWIDVTKSSLSALLTAVISREKEVRRLETLTELDSAKTALFSNASHELRTPLTLILGPLNDCLAELEPTNSRIKPKLATAVRNVDRLSRLVDSLMDFSRMEAGRLEGRYSPVLFGPYVAELATVFRPVIEKAQLDFSITYDKEETGQIFIDRDYMEKIVFNLIGNAFKYTLAGSIAVEVVYTDSEVHLIVRDTGVGIPAMDIPKIWERFHRVEATSRTHEGTGIGLSLTKHFVQMHGGTITVKSKVPTETSDDHGSEFTARFPLGKDHLPAARISDDVQNSGKKSYARGIVAEAARWRLVGDAITPSDSDESYGSSDGPRVAELSFEPSDLIILADDVPDMLDYIRNILSRYCHVITAPNGQVCLELARRHQPQLIITDVMMPVLDGFGLLNAVREDPTLGSIPIILLTARAADSNRAEGMMSGADDYIPKPFSSKELLARASFQIQLGKRRREMELKFQERSKEIQILSDLAPSGLFRIDTEGNMILTNDRFRELSGVKPGLDHQWLDLVHEDYRETVKSTIKDALDGHVTAQVDFVFLNGNWVKGYVRWWERGLVGTVTDMTLTRLYEESLRKRAEEAEERRIEAEERRRGQELLVDVTSHELRQPLSAVINSASLVAENLLKIRDQMVSCKEKSEPFLVTQELLEQVNEDLEGLNAIEMCGLAQGHIVNDILTLSRMQLHMLTIQEAVFPLVREVRQVCSILINEMKSKGISNNLEFGDSIRALGVKFVSADKVRFGQVMINLLSNAIRFSQTSIIKAIGIKVEVSRNPPNSDDTCLRPLDGPDDLVPIAPGEKAPIYVYVYVHDSGPGLKPKDLELLFQRFQKGTNSEETFGGSGLGLFVSRKICDLLGGRIEVDANSVGGQGSTFRFFVCMRTEPAPLPKTPKRGSSESVVKSQLRVLVAEDNQINRTILCRQLKASNCITESAINGAEAVDLVMKAGDNRFDCILMDCEMPVMSGLDATRELRRLESLGIIPPQRIIALTGNAREGQIQNALQSGMDEVVTKPYRLPELLERIRPT